MAGATTLALAAALTAPIIGHALPDHERPGPVTFLDRQLEPVAGAPRMPARTGLVEVSPDGARVVAQVGRRLRFYGMRSGEPQGSMRLARRARVLWWQSPRRLLAVRRGAGRRTVVHGIDPRRRRIIGSARLRGGLHDADHARGRELLLLGSDERQRVVIVTAGGRSTHTVRMPDMTTGSIHGRLVAGGGGNRTSLYRVNPSTGRAERFRYRTSLGRFVAGTPTIVTQFGSYLDRRTLAIEATVDPFPGRQPIGYPKGVGTDRGALFFNFGDTPATNGAKAYDAAGRLRWQTTEHADLAIAFSDRIYFARRADPTTGYTVTVLDGATGAVMRRLDGRYRLQAPVDGRRFFGKLDGDDLLHDGLFP